METNNDQNSSRPALRRSAIGIAAFIAGSLSLCILVSYLGFLVAYFATSEFGRGINVPLMLIIVLGSTSLLSLVTLILGIIAVIQKNRKKLFAILALVEWVVVVLLMVISFFTFFLFTGA